MGLIEILVSVVLLSVGLLGIVGLQARATQLSMAAEDVTRAAHLADDLAAQMRALRALDVGAGRVQQWQARVADVTALGLPAGDGQVEVAGPVATITITWQPPGRDPARYRTQVIIP